MINFLNIFLGVCIFIIGSLFGSFFSLALYRIPKHEDIILKNSYCPNCKHKLNFFDLIPILSFCIRRGKCKYCGEKISLRYPLIEIFNACIFLLMYCILGYNLNLLIAVTLYVILFLVLGIFFVSKKNNLIQKKGVFITELVVAMIFFVIVLTSMYVVIRNNTNRTKIVLARSNALNLAIKNVELSKLTDYDALSSFSSDEVLDNINYHIDVEVLKLADEDKTKQDIVKKIETKVTYSIDGKEYEFKLNAVKGREL